VRDEGPGATPPIGARVAALDWRTLREALLERGFARTGPLLRAQECDALRALYPEDRHFRSRVEMERHRFGRGDYAYLRAPLPSLIAELRGTLYARLVPIANRFSERLGRAMRYPRSHSGFLARCHASGQTRPTPLLLRYGAEGYNCLHQDRYGEVGFPLQATALLSQPGRDFRGGAFLLYEQRPRAQARVEVIELERGELVLFPSFERPLPGAAGFVRAAVKHGVARVESGERFALGVIFHDAR
jgi:hypothetical protein